MSLADHQSRGPQLEHPSHTHTHDTRTPPICLLRESGLCCIGIGRQLLSKRRWCHFGLLPLVSQEIADNQPQLMLMQRGERYPRPS